jgi:hypothetical protein
MRDPSSYIPSNLSGYSDFVPFLNCVVIAILVTVGTLHAFGLGFLMATGVLSIAWRYFGSAVHSH